MPPHRRQLILRCHHALLRLLHRAHICQRWHSTLALAQGQRLRHLLSRMTTLHVGMLSEHHSVSLHRQ